MAKLVEHVRIGDGACGERLDLVLAEHGKDDRIG